MRSPTTKVKCGSLGVDNLPILLLISACIAITWSSDVVDLGKARTRKTYRKEGCLNIFRDCFRKASTPHGRRSCVLLYAKCSIQSKNADDGFQSLRREYKAQLDFFQDVIQGVKWW
ncbi:hypothetical protein ScPMuIL_002651 [Solemya velum]